MVRTSLGTEDTAQSIDAGAYDCVMMCCPLGELKGGRKKQQHKSDLMAG
jgi:hypothetical protein